VREAAAFKEAPRRRAAGRKVAVSKPQCLKEESFSGKAVRRKGEGSYRGKRPECETMHEGASTRGEQEWPYHADIAGVHEPVWGSAAR